MINPLSLPQTCAVIAALNPLDGLDHQIAAWFHLRLTGTFVTVLRALSEPGSGQWIGIVLVMVIGFFVWKRAWPALVTLVVAVPGGMLLNELVKITVQRHRPFVEGSFVDWSGYSFASGHTIGATLLYGQLALFLLPLMTSRRCRRLLISTACGLILLVGFSRIALGAHYLTDVLCAMVFGSTWLGFCDFAVKPMRRARVELDLPAPAELAVAQVAGELAVVPVEIEQRVDVRR